MSQAAREDPRVTANRRTVQQAALDLLSSDGIGGLTVERLADASGVSRSTIYRHWPDPRILVAAAFEDILGRGAEPEGAAGDPAERLLEYLRDYARRLNDPTYATVLITVIEWSWRDPEFARAQARTFDDSRSRARAILQAGRTAGAFPTDLPIEEAVEAAVAPFLYRRLVLRRVITERQIRVLHARLTGSG
jgi:AcrR family transcriptional regulator